MFLLAFSLPWVEYFLFLSPRKSGSFSEGKMKCVIIMPGYFSLEIISEFASRREINQEGSSKENFPNSNHPEAAIWACIVERARGLLLKSLSISVAQGKLLPLWEKCAKGCFNCKVAGGSRQSHCISWGQ